jgi:hypothetical protein
LVAPEGTKIPKGGGEGSGHPVAVLQQGLKNLLALEFQLERVDYTKKNFVHADMSPDQFSKSMADRGESFIQMLFTMMGQAIAQQAGRTGRASDADLLLALFAPDRSFRLKRAMAVQITDLGGMLGLDGPQGSTLITERNKVALDVLKKQIAAGKKKIGIFYGAGHLPDMEKRLLADFSLKEQKTRWLDAWNLRASANRKMDPLKPAPKSPAPKSPTPPDKPSTNTSPPAAKQTHARATDVPPKSAPSPR